MIEFDQANCANTFVQTVQNLKSLPNVTYESFGEFPNSLTIAIAFVGAHFLVAVLTYFLCVGRGKDSLVPQILRMAFSLGAWAAL